MNIDDPLLKQKLLRKFRDLKFIKDKLDRIYQNFEKSQNNSPNDSKNFSFKSNDNKIRPKSKIVHQSDGSSGYLKSYLESKGNKNYLNSDGQEGSSNDIIEKTDKDLILRRKKDPSNYKIKRIPNSTKREDKESITRKDIESKKKYLYRN